MVAQVINSSKNPYLAGQRLRKKASRKVHRLLHTQPGLTKRVHTGAAHALSAAKCLPEPLCNFICADLPESCTLCVPHMIVYDIFVSPATPKASHVCVCLIRFGPVCMNAL